MTPTDPSRPGRPPGRARATERPGRGAGRPRNTSDAAAIARMAGDDAALARRILDDIPGLIVTVLDTEMRVVSLRSAATIHGQSARDVLGRSMLELVPPKEAVLLAPVYGAALRGKEQYFTFRRDDNGRTYGSTAGPLRGEDGAIAGIIIVSRDITEQAQAEQRAATLLERFLFAFEHAPLPMVVLGADGRIRYANEQLRQLTGRVASDLEEQALVAMIDPRDRDRFADTLSGLLSGEVTRATTDARIEIDGELPASCSWHMTGRDPDDPTSGITIQIVDETERHRHDAQLRYLTGHDTLTGLVNRSRFEALIEAHLERGERYGHEGAVVLIDVDHFRQINDVHGRGVGDEQLIEVTGLLRRGLQGTAVVARLGSDEFAVLLPRGDVPAAMAVAQQIHAAAQDHATAARRTGRVTFTLSIGVAAFSPEVRAPSDVLVLAEHAVTTAKRGGRDRIAVPELVTRPGERRSQTAIGRLRRAIRDERFVLHAQPIVRLADDHVSQHELLVRMLDEDGELVPPGSFLPLAEHYGLIGEIDAWVARQAVAALPTLPPDVRLQVNISGRSLDHPALLDGIADGLQVQAGAAPRLIFELTETAAIANLPQALAFAQRLRELGCELALDDFGSGFSGLHYLKHLPFSYLKIDGEFISDVAISRTDHLIVEGILAITRGMGVRTIAEFVGDRPCLEHLRGMGVDFAQGFFLGKPQPLSGITVSGSAP